MNGGGAAVAVTFADTAEQLLAERLEWRQRQRQRQKKTAASLASA